MTIPQALQIAEQHHRAGQLATAEAICRQVLALHPNHPDALHLLGIITHQAGRKGAAELIRKAIAANPGGSQYYHLNLGNVLSAEGHLDEAATAYRRALQIDPNYGDAHYNLGIALQSQGHLDEAIAAYRGALRVKPDLAMAHNNLGVALKTKGRLEEAMASYEKAVRIRPDFVDAYSNLGVALNEKRHFAEAVNACRHALQINPGHADAWYNLGNAFKSQGLLDKAVEAYHRALQIKPGYATALTNLAATLNDQGRLSEADGMCRRALASEPECVEALNNLGAILKEQGHLDESIAFFQRAMRFQPESFLIHSNILAVLHYSPQITLSELFEAHTEYDRLHAAPLRAAWEPHENPRDPGRQLRLGFISPHFASHPVGRFLVRPLENLDPGQFHVTCYSDTLLTDDVTTRIQTAAALWRDVSCLTDVQLADRIRKDGVDILFDLAGHTAGNRLQVFARKPAPIQITWLDYVGTTGLSAMDYILADPREIPPASEPWYREKVLRIPEDYICFDPPSDAPPVGPLPALKNGQLMFASFNIPAKVNERIVDIWAQILHRVPRARLMLKNRGLDDPGTRSYYQRLFAGRGIGPDRLELRGWSPSLDVLACYNQVDVALDTFPYNGGLTTCEAIWMGVPVVTCPGETFASRHGITHLSTAGLTETIAGNLDAYVDLAVELAGDLNRLAALRAGLRQRVAASPLCDGKLFAGRLTRILRDVWRQWALHSI